MGYAYYEISRPDQFGKRMPRGYGYPCKCHKRGCKERIDRGIAYLCYNCTWYFCGEHLTNAYEEDGNTEIIVECFAGESSQVCDKCAKLLQKGEK